MKQPYPIKHLRRYLKAIYKILQNRIANHVNPVDLGLLQESWLLCLCVLGNHFLPIVFSNAVC